MATLDTRNPVDAFLGAYSSLKGEYRAQDAAVRQQESHEQGMSERKQRMKFAESSEGRAQETHEGQKESRGLQNERTRQLIDQGDDEHTMRLEKFGWARDKQAEWEEMSGHRQTMAKLGESAARAGLTGKQLQNTLTGYKVKAHKKAEFVAAREQAVNRMDALRQNGDSQGLYEAMVDAKEKGLLNFTDAMLVNPDEMKKTMTGIAAGEIDPNHPDALKVYNEVFKDRYASTGESGKYEVARIDQGMKPGTQIISLRDKETGEIVPMTEFQSSNNFDPVKQFGFKELVSAGQARVEQVKWLQDNVKYAQAEAGLVRDVMGGLSSKGEAMGLSKELADIKKTKAQTAKEESATVKNLEAARKYGAQADKAVKKAGNKPADQWQALKDFHKDDTVVQLAVETVEAAPDSSPRDVSKVMEIAAQRAEEEDSDIQPAHIYDAVELMNSEKATVREDSRVASAIVSRNEDVSEKEAMEWVKETAGMSKEDKNAHFAKRLEEKRGEKFKEKQDIPWYLPTPRQ